MISHVECSVMLINQISWLKHQPFFLFKDHVCQEKNEINFLDHKLISLSFWLGWRGKGEDG